MNYFLMIACLLCTSCSMASWYPTLGAVAGGGVGSLAGPAGSALGAGSGALVGEVLQGNEEVKEAKETIQLLTHGDVSALVEKGLASQTSGFEDFTQTIKRILIGAACILGIYLCLPIFIARRTAEACSKSEAKKHLTRAPFPTNEKP